MKWLEGWIKKGVWMEVTEFEGPHKVGQVEDYAISTNEPRREESYFGNSRDDGVDGRANSREDGSLLIHQFNELRSRLRARTMMYADQVLEVSGTGSLLRIESSRPCRLYRTRGDPFVHH